MTIGEEKGDSDSLITSASRSCWRSLRKASMSWGCIGLGLCLKGVSSLRVMWCYIVSSAKIKLMQCKTFRMDLSFLVIPSFDSWGTGESVELNMSSWLWSGFVWLSESGVLMDRTLLTACISAMTAFGDKVMSCCDSFLSITGMQRGSLDGEFTRLLFTRIPPVRKLTLVTQPSPLISVRGSAAHWSLKNFNLSGCNEFKISAE